MKNSIKQVVFGFILVVAGGVTSLGISKYLFNNKAYPLKSTEPTNHVKLVNNKLDYTQPTNLEVAAELSINTVVHVKTEVVTQSPINPMYQFLYGRNPQPQIAKASGSGVIISDDGYIVTNNHVVEDAENINVTLNNNKSFKAEVVGTDPNTDLALLKIDQENLPFIQYGNSNDTKIGEWVLAVGNPYNLTSTVTAGIISAKGRDINILRNDPYNGLSAIESFIQTDAAVNPGNSGGALVNAKGELIGINSAIQSNTGSYTGYSFAIPVNIVKKVVGDLKEFGTVQRAFIGISIRNIDESLANEKGIDNLNGVYINGTTENGSAAKAGVEEGDIIRKIGNKTVKNVPELQEQISQFRPGDKINITINRGEKEVELPIVLKNLNGNEKIVSNETVKAIKVLGAEFSEPSKQELKNLGIRGGVKVQRLYNGKLRSVGIDKGFIITSVNHQAVKTLEQFNSIVQSLKGGILIGGIYENGKKEYYGFGI